MKIAIMAALAASTLLAAGYAAAPAFQRKFP
jgi:hypothetical protein